jgi:hypothetical protein
VTTQAKGESRLDRRIENETGRMGDQVTVWINQILQGAAATRMGRWRGLEPEGAIETFAHIRGELDEIVKYFNAKLPPEAERVGFIQGRTELLLTHQGERRRLKLTDDKVELYAGPGTEESLAGWVITYGPKDLRGYLIQSESQGDLEPAPTDAFEVTEKLFAEFFALVARRP